MWQVYTRGKVVHLKQRNTFVVVLSEVKTQCRNILIKHQNKRKKMVSSEEIGNIAMRKFVMVKIRNTGVKMKLDTIINEITWKYAGKQKIIKSKKVTQDGTGKGYGFR